MERLAASLMATFMGTAQAAVPVQLPGPGVELRGILYLPAGAGPHPAVVLLHGCSGMYTARGRPLPAYEGWAEYLRERGYVALLVDSFGPRGEKEVCTQKVRKVTENRERPADARAALEWLAARPDVQPSGIHLLGWSHGGATTLHVMERGNPANNSASSRSFRSAIAMYPGCRGFLSHTYEPVAPLLIQAGGADDWTPARHCEALAARSGGTIEIDVYPGAHHAFDRPGGTVRYRPDVRNLASPTGQGAHVGGHPEARTKARARVEAFLARHTDVPRGTKPAPTKPLP